MATGIIFFNVPFRGAEAATLREYGCNLYAATQDGVVSITGYITSLIDYKILKKYKYMNILTHNPIKKIPKNRHKLQDFVYYKIKIKYYTFYKI